MSLVVESEGDVQEKPDEYNPSMEEVEATVYRFFMTYLLKEMKRDCFTTLWEAVTRQPDDTPLLITTAQRKSVLRAYMCLYGLGDSWAKTNIPLELPDE